MSNVQIAPQTYAPPASGTVAGFDFEKLLPLEVIRQHTKTDDVPSVTDFLLQIYRKSAYEAAEKYTGFLLTGTKQIVEPVNLLNTSSNINRRVNHFYHETQYPFGSPIAFMYGQKNRAPVQLQAEVGSSRIKLPMIMDEFGLGCCNPCADKAMAHLLYTAGFGCEEDIPAAIALGALKYIAHVVENAGDIVVATNEAGGSSTGSVGVSSAADPAVASGAISIWRVAMRDAI